MQLHSHINAVALPPRTPGSNGCKWVCFWSVRRTQVRFPDRELNWRQKADEVERPFRAPIRTKSLLDRPPPMGRTGAGFSIRFARVRSSSRPHSTLPGRCSFRHRPWNWPEVRKGHRSSPSGSRRYAPMDRAIGSHIGPHRPSAAPRRGPQAWTMGCSDRVGSLRRQAVCPGDGWLADRSTNGQQR